MFLSFHQTSLLRKYVNEESDFGHKYFATMTWSKQEQERMREAVKLKHPEWTEIQIIQDLQNWRERQTLSFLRMVSRKSKVHFSVLLSWEICDLATNPHAHAIVMAEKPIKRSLWNGEWRHGLQKWMETYNPTIRKTENGVVGYVMGWGNRHQFPPKHRAKSGTYVFCPKTKRSCKNGNCPHHNHFQEQLRHVVELSDEEEKQMEREWIARGSWDLVEWNDKNNIRNKQSESKTMTSQDRRPYPQKGLIGHPSVYTDDEGGR